ncbi:acetoacetate--CoA ligase [Beggiatoa leptomitoformis]|uniref:Acetoacetate--CoA ligase n=1 Tax=Beggiatoa leptomitoformis TaxID=288004 RepID=A0A2N9YD40_9GAMM|nr:acetoacetate--CoA ligase [Beggiatoa leptomitoformis]ALG69199.1 acetoacetate--CoA ligase [Beggiatoa leptomitoformis]AUI68370.1 acetoacetate--CoA ligase [Beggiatoa leptomitoformis]
MTNLLWNPTTEAIDNANVTTFRHAVNQQWQLQLMDYSALYQWSIEQPTQFWQSLWTFTNLIAETQGDVVLNHQYPMFGARWFPQARLNFAENLLRRQDSADALVFWGENQVKRRLSYQDLYAEVSVLAQALRADGVQAGDRVAGYLPNMPEAIIAMLATSSIGAVWSSCSPDFGAQGLIDRFGQIEPKILLTADGYFYNGKPHDSLGNLPKITQAISSIERVIVIPYVNQLPAIGHLNKTTLYSSYVAGYTADTIEFNRLPFNHPLYILYSSGTTGVPKCIVHGAGGTLLQHLKEHVLHTDIKPNDRVFYFTTCGWMMWNWLVSALAAQATVLLYDGSPFYPTGQTLFDYVEQEKITVFGTSAKFIDALNKQGIVPNKTHNLQCLRAILSTGSPLLPESFDFVYHAIKADVQLSSISGGTDIVSCFALGNPVLPVWRGELQCRGLGLAVEIFDDAGQALRAQKGELVCTKPFPAMPIYFWNDPQGEKYHAAYFERFPNVWCHGDYAELTAHDGIIIYGRSDAVLNPGGVRIGTAEIYRQVEQLPEILESLVIGQTWADDVRVVLFVRLQTGLVLDDVLRERIKQYIRQNTTPRHVPAKIVQVADIPRTKSGKIVELAVRNVVHGLPVKNREALANPEALDLFANLALLNK